MTANFEFTLNDFDNDGFSDFASDGDDGLSTVVPGTLDGGAGDDDLYGSTGNDVLIGGTGNDEIWGFGGADEFRFREGDGNDLIMDFKTGSRIVVEGDHELLRRGDGDEYLGPRPSMGYDAVERGGWILRHGDGDSVTIFGDDPTGHIESSSESLDPDDGPREVARLDEVDQLDGPFNPGEVPNYPDYVRHVAPDPLHLGQAFGSHEAAGIDRGGHPEPFHPDHAFESHEAADADRDGHHEPFPPNHAFESHEAAGADRGGHPGPFPPNYAFESHEAAGTDWGDPGDRDDHPDGDPLDEEPPLDTPGGATDDDAVDPLECDHCDSIVPEGDAVPETPFDDFAVV